MKTTDHFKRTIQMFLEQRAAEDELFAKRFWSREQRKMNYSPKATATQPRT